MRSPHRVSLLPGRLGLTDMPAVVLLGDLGFISDSVATSVGESVTPD